MTDYGLKVVKPGYSIWNATDTQTVFNSSQNIYKTILDKSGFHTIQNGETYHDIEHEKPYIPAFLCFNEGYNWSTSTPTGRFTRVMHNAIYGAWDPFNNQMRGREVYADETKLRIEYTLGGADPGARIGYFIYIEKSE